MMTSGLRSRAATSPAGPSFATATSYPSTSRLVLSPNARSTLSSTMRICVMGSDGHRFRWGIHARRPRHGASQWKRDDESRSARPRIFHPGSAAMQLHELAHHREPDAASSDGLRIPFQPMIRLPDALALFGRNAGAFIDDLDQQ